MNRTELKSKMLELHKQYAAVAAELKEIEELEKKTALRERYKDYKLKVFVGTSIPEEPKFEEVTDEDREHGKNSENTGIPLSGGFTDGAYVLLKSEEDFPRIKTLYDRIQACKVLEDKGTKDKEKHIKIILGE